MPPSEPPSKARACCWPTPCLRVSPGCAPLHQPTRGLHLNARRLLVLQVLQRYGPQLGAILINAGFFAWTCALVLYRDSPMVWPAMLVGYPTLVFLVRLCPLCSAHHARARSLRAAGLLTTRARRQGKEIYAWILIR